ncbi:hypothetical protein MG293_000465 [Ovis ammon polii]|uniref:Uncharacterized protein n=1 Tax=Ovis ammon polii TaxID=230172 RepID=A0AAD4UQI1_OVIAM|nr:hypothetical protein MG293_000465 [Ovis ammon polii]
MDYSSPGSTVHGIFLDALKEDDSESAFLDAGIAPLKMLKGRLSYWWLNMPSVGHSALQQHCPYFMNCQLLPLLPSAGKALKPNSDPARGCLTRHTSLFSWIIGYSLTNIDISLVSEEIEYGSMPEETLKNTNGIAYESSADSYLQGKSSYNSMC